MAYLAKTNQYCCGVYLTNALLWRIMYTLMEYTHLSMYWKEHLRLVTDLVGGRAVRSYWNLYGTFPVL
jgi:hypothetical protein